MPVETCRHDMLRRQPPATEFGRNYEDRNDAAGHMEKVQPGNAEIRGTELHGVTGWVLSQPPAFCPHVRPFAQVESRENDTEQRCHAHPLYA